MNDKKILGLLIKIITFVAFNSLFFIISGLYHLPAEWIAFGAINFSLLMLCLSPSLVPEGKQPAAVKFPIYSVSAAYFILSLLSGIIIFAVKPEKHIGYLAFVIVLTAIYFIILIGSMLVNEHTTNNFERQRAEKQYVAEGTAKLKSILAKTDDADVRKQVNKAYNVLLSSQSKSNSSAMEYEIRVIQLIDRLEELISDGNKEEALQTAKDVAVFAEKRNQLLHY